MPKTIQAAKTQKSEFHLPSSVTTFGLGEFLDSTKETPTESDKYTLKSIPSLSLKQIQESQKLLGLLLQEREFLPPHGQFASNEEIQRGVSATLLLHSEVIQHCLELLERLEE